MKFIGYFFYDINSLNTFGYSQIHFPFKLKKWKNGISILSLSDNGYIIIHNFWIKIFKENTNYII